MSSRLSNEFKEMLLTLISTDTFKAILMLPGFVFNPATHDSYAAVSANELPTGSGYTTGGITLISGTIVRDDVNHKVTLEWDNPSWPASGGDIQAGSAIIYDDTPTTPTADVVVGFIDFNGIQTTYDGGVFTISNPFIQLENA